MPEDKPATDWPLASSFADDDDILANIGGSPRRIRKSAFLGVQYVGELVLETDTILALRGGVLVSIDPFDPQLGPVALGTSTIQENSLPGTFIGTLSVLNSDETWTFSLLDSATNRVALSGSNLVRGLAGLDFEETPTFEVTVQADDGLGLRVYTDLTIAVTNVADEPPTAIFLSNNSIVANSDVGTAIATLTAIDPDVGDSATFTLLDDAGGKVSIVGNELRVADAIELADGPFTITIDAEDEQGNHFNDDFEMEVVEFPVGAIGAWFSDEFVDGQRPYIPNAESAEPPAPSLLPPGRRFFENSLYWAGSGVVKADGGISAPDGSMDASVLTGTGNFFLSPAANVVLEAGTYTLAASYKRNGASDQSFVSKFFTAGDTSSVRTATNVWQRYIHTATLAAGSHLILPFASSDGVTGADLQICDIELFEGSSDLHEVLGGHLYFGRNAGDASFIPELVDGVVETRNGGFGTVQFEEAVILGPVSCFAVVEKIEAGSDYQAIFSSPRQNGFADFSSFLEQAKNPRFVIDGTNLVSSTVSQGSGLWEFLGLGKHMIAQVYDGAKGVTFVDDIRAYEEAGTPTGFTTADLNVFSVNAESFTTGYDLISLRLYDRDQSDAEVRQTYSALKAHAASEGVFLAVDTNIIAFEGDSITAGGGGIIAYPHRYGPNADPLILGIMAAKPSSFIGTTAINMQDRITYVDAIIPPNKNGRKFILSGMITNDLTTRTTAQYLADLASYLDDRYAAGWDKIALGTVPPRADATFNTKRNVVNPVLRTWVGLHCDAIIDFAADPDYGTDAAGSDTSKVGDGTHPTNLMQAAMETIARPVLNELMV